MKRLLMVISVFAIGFFLGYWYGGIEAGRDILDLRARCDSLEGGYLDVVYTDTLDVNVQYVGRDSAMVKVVFYSGDTE